MLFKFYKRPLLNWINEHIIMYPSPLNINYLWSFGFLSFAILIIQIITGLLLSIHYTPHIDYAFISVEHIMRDVNYGWLLRYFHSNGASMFFIVIYIHIGKGLYFGSYIYPRELLWVSGVIMFILLMGIAFLGYVLPWGQMSFWGATVITNFVTALPLIGEHILYWIWGGFAINNSTLNRIYTLHFLLPFLLLGLVFLHFILLHHVGSGNPLGIDWVTYIPFYPYFIIKDFFSFILFLILFSIFVYLFPNFLGHSDNYIEANPYVTPTHVVPEWYFLPFYAILRSIPNKFWGVFSMLFAIIILIFFPFITNYNFINNLTNKNSLNNYKLFGIFRSGRFRPIFSKFYWLLVVDVIFLGWIGMQPAEQPFIFLGQLGLIYYFLFFLMIIPLLNILEQHFLWNYPIQKKYIWDFFIFLRLFYKNNFKDSMDGFIKKSYKKYFVKEVPLHKQKFRSLFELKYKLFFPYEDHYRNLLDSETDLENSFYDVFEIEEKIENEHILENAYKVIEKITTSNKQNKANNKNMYAEDFLDFPKKSDDYKFLDL